MKRYIKSAVQPFTIRSNADIEALLEVAKDNGTDAFMLKSFVENYPSCPTLLSEVARNPNVTPEILEYMVDNDLLYTDVTLCIANSTLATPLTLTKLADKILGKQYQFGADIAALQIIAENTDTPLGTLERLAAFPDESVRKRVAYNKNAGTELLCQMTVDDPWMVEYILNNPIVDSEFIRTLASFEFLNRLADSDDRFIVLLYVARDPRTPSDVLDELARRGSYYNIQKAVIGNPNTDANTLKYLCQDPYVGKFAEQCLLSRGAN